MPEPVRAGQSKIWIGSNSFTVTGSVKVSTDPAGITRMTTYDAEGNPVRGDWCPDHDSCNCPRNRLNMWKSKEEL